MAKKSVTVGRYKVHTTSMCRHIGAEKEQQKKKNVCCYVSNHIPSAMIEVISMCHRDIMRASGSTHDIVV